MGLEINKYDLVIREADKSWLHYTTTIANRIIKLKDSLKISGDLDRIWRICGYASKEKFDKLFKQ